MDQLFYSALVPRFIPGARLEPSDTIWLRSTLFWTIRMSFSCSTRLACWPTFCFHELWIFVAFTFGPPVCTFGMLILAVF